MLSAATTGSTLPQTTLNQFVADGLGGDKELGTILCPEQRRLDGQNPPGRLLTIVKERHMSLAIVGLGTALPATSMDRQAAAEVAEVLCCRDQEQARWLRGMCEQSGVLTRRTVMPESVVADIRQGTRQTDSPFLPSGAEGDRGPSLRRRMEQYEQCAGPLAVEAARAALEQSRLPPSRITHLVTVSCTGFQAPGFDFELIRELHLPPSTMRTHIGFMGCHGALNGLRVASAFAGADAGACVLLCATELCSLHYRYGWEQQQIVANALFADGSGAVVGLPAAAAARSAWRVAATGSCLIPNSADAMTWTLGDFGFEMTLAPSVPGLIARHLRAWLESWLASQELALGDICSWAVHPGGPRILDAVEEALGLTQEQTAVPREVFAQCGNMSSATVLFILDRFRRRQALRPCVALGFGPGLAAEAVLFR
jgi:predicted naringenin-chalcone synthase